MSAEITLKIPAIHCDNCVNTVTRALKGLPSVEVIEADATSKLVHVRFEEAAVSAGQIRQALDEVGFSPED